MTVRQRVFVFGGGGLLVAALLIRLFMSYQSRGDDRPPIEVENGSIKLLFQALGNNKWTLHQPADDVGSGPSIGKVRFEQTIGNGKNTRGIRVSTTDANGNVCAVVDDEEPVAVTYDRQGTAAQFQLLVSVRKTPPNGKRHVDVEISDQVLVVIGTGQDQGLLTIGTAGVETLVRFEGTDPSNLNLAKTCQVTSGNFTVAIIH